MADLLSSVFGGAVGGTAVGAALVRLSLDTKQYQGQLAARIGSANLAALNRMHGGGQAGRSAAQGGGAGVNIYNYITARDVFSADLPDMIEEGARRALVMLGRP